MCRQDYRLVGPFCARISPFAYISCQGNSIRSRQTRGRGQWIGRKTEGSIEVELAVAKRRDADASPEITFGRTVRFWFRFPVATGAAEFPASNPLNLSPAHRGGEVKKRPYYFTIALHRAVNAPALESKGNVARRRNNRGHALSALHSTRSG